MTHMITALVLKGPYDTALAAESDLHGLPMGFELTMFPISPYYTAYMQHHLGISGQLEGGLMDIQNRFLDPGCFPTERVSAVLMARITRQQQPLFALINTQYHAGIGDQWARLYQGDQLIQPWLNKISPILVAMGVKPSPGLDAFDTVGLGVNPLRNGNSPDYLDKYADLVERFEIPLFYEDA